MAVMNVRSISKEIKGEIKREVDEILLSGKRAPHLVAIMVGDNPASKAYVNNKVKTCDELGIKSTLLHFKSNLVKRRSKK